MSDNAVTICTFDQGREGLPDGVEEILHIGRALAADIDAPLHWLVLGDLPEQASAAAGQFGVSSLRQIEDPKLSPAQADAAVHALCVYYEEHTPRALIVHQTLDARIVAPRVAGRLNKAVVMNGISLNAVGDNFQITASAYGGDTRVIYEVGPGPILSFIANAAVPERGEGAPGELAQFKKLVYRKFNLHVNRERAV